MKGLLLIAHGSRLEQSNKEFETMVSELGEKFNDTYDKVKASFLECASPGIEVALHSMIEEGIDEIKIYPFFLNSGKHVHKDIPEKIDTLKEQFSDVSFELLPHFGSSKHIISIIADDLI